ncbi:MAG: hypothetical protein HWD59_10515 [Coxiellaceae bacterium]|nr:MAG: hypothetical protein HWD59_10515 [Coxiellaceae bacterium]
MLLVSWYFYACFLYKANDNLTSRTATYQETFRLIFKRFHHIIAVYFILFLLVVALFSTMQLSHFITNAQARSIAAIIMALAALWLLWTLMYANTRVVLDNANAIAAFKFSFQIVKGNWIRNFLVWLAVMLVFILIGFGIVALFNLFHAKYLMIATVVILALIMPIVINSIVIVQFNDLKLRYQTKQ